MMYYVLSNLLIIIRWKLQAFVGEEHGPSRPLDLQGHKPKKTEKGTWLAVNMQNF